MIGAGFNYAFFQADPEGDILPMCPLTTFVELGISEIVFLSERGIPLPFPASLHLARTPITECEDNQDKFIEYLTPLFIKHRKKYNLCSIGLHLTGSRFSGLGLLGFSEPYQPTPSNLRLVNRFITELKTACGTEVWIENASLYTEKLGDILTTWDHVNRICEETGAKIIFDVAHAIVEATNAGLNPLVTLGAVPWKYVVELHLSGIAKGRDGSLHDGHNFSIDPRTWALLGVCRQFLSKTTNLIYTIEHTSPEWRNRRAEFDLDFSMLDEILKLNTVAPTFAASREQYGRSYLSKHIKQSIPLLEPYIKQENICFDAIFTEWIDGIISSGHRAVFDKLEVPQHEREVSHVAVYDFLEFFKTKASNNRRGSHR